MSPFPALTLYSRPTTLESRSPWSNAALSCQNRAGSQPTETRTRWMSSSRSVVPPARLGSPSKTRRSRTSRAPSTVLFVTAQRGPKLTPLTIMWLPGAPTHERCPEPRLVRDGPARAEARGADDHVARGHVHDGPRLAIDLQAENRLVPRQPLEQHAPGGAREVVLGGVLLVRIARGIPEASRHPQLGAERISRHHGELVLDVVGVYVRPDRKGGLALRAAIFQSDGVQERAYIFHGSDCADGVGLGLDRLRARLPVPGEAAAQPQARRDEVDGRPPNRRCFHQVETVGLGLAGIGLALDVARGDGSR